MDELMNFGSQPRQCILQGSTFAFEMRGLYNFDTNLYQLLEKLQLYFDYLRDML